MSTINRRAFLTAATGASLGLSTLMTMPTRGVGVAFAEPVAPDPNDPNDPNKILDAENEIGKPYRGWKEGELDLHFIHTGVGENAFYICPDGTTILFDAGDRDAANYKDGVPILPDQTRRPGEWIARYISRVKPGLEKIDYVLASHFHTDHIGDGRFGDGVGGDDTDRYEVSGIAHVGKFYHFGTAFDRGYPSYDRPTTWAPRERENLVKFWNYKERTDGLRREEFIVGALDQIKLLNNPEAYDFHIRNVCRNGVIWGGPDGAENVDYFEKWPRNKEENKNENTRSLGVTLQFGNFRFHTAGDASGVLRDDEGNDLDFEGALGRVVGPVDVCKANHHSYRDAMRKSFINAVQARAYVVCVWDRWHLQDNTATAMCDQSAEGYPGPRLMCPTAVHAGNEEMMQGKSWRSKLVERGGHVVVKAYDGGARYKIYYLTAKDESMNVELVFGPFESTGVPRLNG
ncbi:MAG: MBL fold metallo-hydrolase [Planctomycetia bacterium]|nr:MBL fold metallo-hydrolase [Planctomycetia bacterium]